MRARYKIENLRRMAAGIPDANMKIELVDVANVLEELLDEYLELKQRVNQ